MARYRKKAEVVEAARWDGRPATAAALFPEGSGVGWQFVNGTEDLVVLHNGRFASYARVGDWVVRYPDGRVGVWGASEFEAAFERRPLDDGRTQ